MKKRLFAVLAAVCIMALALTACGSSGGSNSGGGGAAPAGSSAGGGSDAGGTTVAGEAYDTGTFTVNVPSGWSVVEVSDLFGETDENGNLAKDPNSLILVKGEAKDEIEAITKPFVRIYYSAGSYLSSKSFYDDAKDIDVKLNGKELIEAYEADSVGFFYQFVNIKEGNGHFECSILKSMDNNDTGLSADNAEVLAIMESLKAD